RGSRGGKAQVSWTARSHGGGVRGVAGTLVAVAPAPRSRAPALQVPGPRAIFIARPGNGLLALALTPLLRRHSDSDKPSRTRVSTSHPPGGSRPCSVSIALHPSWLGSASPRAGSSRSRHAATTASAALQSTGTCVGSPVS